MAKTKTTHTPGLCRNCQHGKQDHPNGMFGCVKAIGLCRCPCWTYDDSAAIARAEGR